MNKQMVIGIVLGAALATAGGVFASYKLMGSKAPAASVLAASENCTEETVTHTGDPKDEHRIAGTALGALLGGAVGKDVGNRDITTAAGAAAGAAAGNQIQKRIQEKIQDKKSYTTTETHCAPVPR